MDKFLVRKKRAKAAHIWINGDTVCRMASTGGLSMRSYSVVADKKELPLCHMCESVSNNPKYTDKTKTPKRFVKNDIESRIYLDVPYAEKDEAKAYGARWDFNLKRWYVTEIDDITGLQKWFSNDQPVSYHPAKKKPVFIDDVVQQKLANSANKANSNGIMEMYVVDCGCLPWDVCTHGNSKR